MLGHLVHKKCLCVLERKGLLTSIHARDASSPNVDIMSNNFRDQTFSEDLCLLQGMLSHPDVNLDNGLFSSDALRAASRRNRILILEQDPDAIGMNLQKSSKKLESNMASYNTYQTNFCQRFAARRAAHRQHIFGTMHKKSSGTLKSATRSGIAASSSLPTSSLTVATSASSYYSIDGRTEEEVAAAPASSKWYSVQPTANSSGKFFERVRKFCSHLDLLPQENWNRQHVELDKLPAWIYCQTKQDILRFCRKAIPGMTSPQMYIKVPGVWTAAHEENNQFRSVNVNHGPGPCEWAGVAAEHVPRLRQLVLETHNIDIYKEEGRWMPPLEYMIEHKVPVITGMQNAGDAITVGIGCIHWVYSRGRTCCSAWNIGDLSFDMFEAAFRRWDDNLEIGEFV